MSLVATFPMLPAVQAATAADGARTITGVAVPWDTPGRVADGTTVVFHPGSIDAAHRPVALRDHDRTRPIGTVTAARDTGVVLMATITVSHVPAGDEALVLAADGALPALSVGAEPTEYRYDPDGTLHVHAADWLELSLLTLGAFPAARVDTVTAAHPPGDTTMPTPVLADPPDTDPTPPPPAPPDQRPDDDDGEAVEPTPAPPASPAPLETETSAAVVPITAGRAPTRAGARHPYAGVDLHMLAGFIAAAAADSRYATEVGRIMASPGARATSPMVAAQLTDITLVGTNNVGAAYRPGYQAELVEIVSHGSPAVDAIRQGDLERGDYPNKTFNQWVLTPQVALQSAEKVAINSTPVSIAPASVPVQTWATGNDLSQQLLDFGSPSFVEDYIRAAGVDYAQVIDTYAVTALLAAATDVPTAMGDNLAEVLSKLFAGLDPTTTPAGTMFALVAWDVGVGAMGMNYSERPAFWDGTMSFGSFVPSVTMGGLSIIVDPNMPPKTVLLGLRNAATWYDLPGTPFSLRAINVGQLGLDVAVYGYGALGVQHPGALVKTTIPDV